MILIRTLCLYISKSCASCSKKTLLTKDYSKLCPVVVRTTQNKLPPLEREKNGARKQKQAAGSESLIVHKDLGVLTSN